MSRRSTYSLTLGVAIGAGVGAALGNVGMGIAVGIALGIALGMALKPRSLHEKMKLSSSASARSSHSPLPDRKDRNPN